MKISARDISQIALFTALTAVGAFIKIPIPVVPITLQVFFVSLSGVLLGSRKGAISQLLYVLIGLAGFPIFTQGGGITYVLKPTFGYLAGFIFGAYLTGKMTEKMKEKNIKNLFIAILSGVGVIYAVGVAYLYMISNFYLGKDFTLWLAFYYGFLLCIGGDLICSYVASVLSYKLLPVIRKWVA